MSISIMYAIKGYSIAMALLGGLLWYIIIMFIACALETTIDVIKDAKNRTD